MYTDKEKEEILNSLEGYKKDINWICSKASFESEKLIYKKIIERVFLPVSDEDYMLAQAAVIFFKTFYHISNIIRENKQYDFMRRFGAIKLLDKLRDTYDINTKKYDIMNYCLKATCRDNIEEFIVAYNKDFIEVVLSAFRIITVRDLELIREQERIIKKDKLYESKIIKSEEDAIMHLMDYLREIYYMKLDLVPNYEWTDDDYSSMKIYDYFDKKKSTNLS